MAVDFDRHNAVFLRTFGEAATFWPGLGNETTVTAIIFRSARLEPTSPGNVTKVFFRLADLPAIPAKGDTVSIGGSIFQINEADALGDGGANVIVRKKSPVGA